MYNLTWERVVHEGTLAPCTDIRLLVTDVDTGWIKDVSTVTMEDRGAALASRVWALEQQYHQSFQPSEQIECEYTQANIDAGGTWQQNCESVIAAFDSAVELVFEPRTQLRRK